MEIVEVTEAQQMAAELSIRIRERMGKPVSDWTRRVAAAKPQPVQVDPDLEESDEVVLYLV